MTNLYCARCGTPTIPGERFCGECGNDLTLPGSVSNAPPLPQGIPPTTPIYQPPVSPQPAYQRPAATSVQPKQGSSPLPLIIGLVVLLAVIGVGGYFLFLNKGSSTNSNQAVANPTSTPALSLPSLNTLAQVSPTAAGSNVSASPTAVDNITSVSRNPPGNFNPTTPTPGSAADTALRQELTDATNTMNALTGFHAVAQTTISGTNLSLDGDFGANGSQFKGQRDGQPFSAIYISQTGYISTDGGKAWVTDTTNTANYAGTLFNLFNGFNFSSTDVVSDAGQETLSGGQSAHKVNLTDNSNGIAVNFWIIDSGGKKTVARVSIADSTTGDSITVDYSKYNEAVNVTAPKL